MNAFLEAVFTSNLEQEESAGVRPTPVCIWGTHGYLVDPLEGKGEFSWAVFEQAD